ncbi:hypothetical protein BKP45_05170 [Anaerobacillus alkalidiazotrophicus]|uniref:Phosphatidylglycerol lysyltransferase n=1 Tax=Anaerobacillus alkalidiazotrophicus TaxID=472963 RepID=A0A1S2MDX8_9BACI|nr:lysylphosphatidylglycerol synthase domain-containing protein [Anaerobacillus alkalidiazotrophicus]OIJ22067.1 hypothetical protein BKP45_05170 [Anaerobacillus alkalidiazotrophicus]
MITLLLWKGDIKSIVINLKELKRSTLCYLCLFQIFTIFLLTFQWVSIAKPILPNLKFKTMFSIQMIGTFVESITPAAKTGGEAIKAILIKNQCQSTYGDAAALITVQKLYSLLVFIPIAFFSILYLVLSNIEIPLQIVVVSFVLLVTMISVLVFSVFYTQQLNTILQK